MSVSVPRFMSCVLPFVILVTAGAGVAQESGKTTAAAADAAKIDGGIPHYIRPETPEQRLARLGTQDDPGMDPDPKKVWTRFGRQYTIQKASRDHVKYSPDKPGMVRPIHFNVFDEVYQENSKFVWVWVPEVQKLTAEERKKFIEEKQKEKLATRYPEETIELMKRLRDDFQPLEPPVSSKRVVFQAASKGLPTSGSWRNSLASGDMNGDGFLDLVVPSQRGSASGVPSIFLGDGAGNWKAWNVKWPHRLDYGSAVVADFNKDKKMDIAFGVHLKGLVVLLGDGKGTFRSVFQEKQFPTRKLVATDVDADGWIDVVALWEGPLALAKETRNAEYGNLRAFLNRSKGEKWEGLNLSGSGAGISGDWLTAANLNGDKTPDFVGSSMYTNATQTVFMSVPRVPGSTPDGPRYEAYQDPAGLVIPSRSNYGPVTSAPFSAKSLDDAIVASSRSWPESLDPKIVPRPPLTKLVSLDRISFVQGAGTRTPIMRLPIGGTIEALSHGDFDRDGHEDVIFTSQIPREAVLLLGDGKGGFQRATLEGLVIAPQRNYDLKVVDLNKDSLPDVVIMYEAAEATALSAKNGSIQVFLNRGTKP